MKILFINSIQMFGGGEIWLLNTMRAMLQRNHQIYLLCRSESPLEKKARREGFKVYAMKMRSDLDPCCIFRTWKIIRENRIDLVCTNMDKELRFGGLAAKLAGVHAVVPRRGSDHPLKNKWIYRWSYMHIASGIIANSIATRQSLLLHCPWLQPDRIQIIYNGIDTRLFSPERGNRLRKELKLSSKEILIGFVGQLDERKGIDTLVKAYSRLTENIQDTVLYIVGEGALEKRLKDMAGKCRGRIVFAGYREDVENVMGAIDMLVLPSLWEGFGFVLIEAMSAEKPVITTTASNMPEIVTHEKDGLLIPPSDTDALTSALRLLIQNPGLRVKMGREGRKKVIEKFTIEKMIDNTETFFLSQMTRK